MSNMEINASLKYSWFETSANVSKLPPQWVIVVGVLLVGYGFYLYLNQEKKATDSK